MSNTNFKKNKIIKNICIFIAILAILLFILSIYIKVYYYDINIKTISYHLVVSLNIVLKLFSKIFNGLINSLLTESNMKIIIIALAVIFSICEFQLKDWIKDITNLEMNGFKLEKQVKVLDDMNKTEQNNIEQLEKKDDIGQDVEEKLRLSKIKMDLLQTMINDPYIVHILERFVDKKIGTLKIPMNVFKQNTSIESIGKIFKYDVNLNSIKINGIKDEIKDIAYDIYIKVKNENKDQ